MRPSEEGTYLSIVDADDFYEPDYLKTMVGAMERYGVDVVECDFYCRDEAAGTERIVEVPAFLKQVLMKPFYPESVEKDIFLTVWNNPLAHIFRRTFVMEHSLQFQDIPSNNDIYFTKMSLMLASSIFHVQRPLAHYRMNIKQQISTTARKNMEKHLCSFARACAAMQGSLFARNCMMLYGSALRDFFMTTMRKAFDDIFREYGQETFAIYEQAFRIMKAQALKRKDFGTQLSYRFWQKLQEEHCCDVEEIARLSTVCFLQELSANASHVALWGYGIRGKRFVARAAASPITIEEIYDNDPAKWDAQGVPHVKSFADQSKGIDAVIVTNSRFYEEIQEEVRQQDASIRVYDFQTYDMYGRLWCGEDFTENKTALQR